MDNGRWLFDRLLRLVLNRARRSSDVHRAVLDTHLERRLVPAHLLLVARLQVERPLVAGADDAVLEDDALHELRCDGCRCSAARRPGRRARTARPACRRRRSPACGLAAPARPSPPRPSRPQSSSPGRASVRLYTDRGPVRRRRTRHGGTLHRTRRRGVVTARLHWPPPSAPRRSVPAASVLDGAVAAALAETGCCRRSAGSVAT